MPIIRDFNKDLVPMDNPIEARKNDLIRITEWLASPAGLKFAAKQALLRTSGNLESFSREGMLNAAGRGTADAASAIATILAQIPVSGTGTHFLFNELSSLAFQNNSFYTGNRFAANQANYTGAITIGKADKLRVRGNKTWEERGFGGTKTSDKIGLSGIGSEDRTLIKKDTVPVVFSVVGEPNSTLVFRGFTQGITDTVSSGWNSINYVGRGETLYTYNSTTRTLGFTLQVPIFSSDEQKPTYSKANALLSYAYPKYGDTGLAQGTVLKLRIGDLIKCFATPTSISHTIATDVPWSTGNTILLLPQVLTFNISVNVIHEKLPERYLGETAFPFLAQPDTAEQASQTKPGNTLTPVIEVGPVTGEMVDYGDGNFIDTNGQFGLRS
jgi:hypothetical protein